MKPRVRQKLNVRPESMSLMMRYQAENRATPTKAELRMMHLLAEIDEPYIFEKAFFADKTFFLVDFYLPRPRRLCLEVDGGYHETQTEYDKARDAYLMNDRRLRVLRISNGVALNMVDYELRAMIHYACKK